MSAFYMADLYGPGFGPDTTDDTTPEPTEQRQLEASRDAVAQMPISPAESKNIWLGIIVLVIILAALQV